MTDTLFQPPHAQPLTGDESFLEATWRFIRNPVEGFGPLAYRQPIVTAKTFGQTLHVISDPVGMTDVLVRHADKFTKTAIDARILGPATKEGLLSVHGEQWKRQRKAVAPIFRKRHVESLAPLITDALSDFTARLDQRSRLDLSRAMADLTFDVLAKALLGGPKGLDRTRLKRATRAVVTGAGTLRPDDLLPWPRWVPRPMTPTGSGALRRLKRAADDLLAERAQNPDDDLVGLLIGADTLSPRERRDNLIGFFIAGHETTALTLTWALYLLGRHRPTAERVRNEVRQVCGTGDVRFDQLADLPFTQAIIDETMRLYPPAPLLNREPREVVNVLGRTLEPGHAVLLNNYVMHRTERLWDQPLLFDPDRFLRDPSLKAKGAPYMPFGAGPRICVGAAFATMEALMVLATLARDFDIRVDDNVYPRPLMTVTLRPEGGVPARLERVVE
ncbi:cytochrome P450 [Algimonas porphyrae]|uniref:Cytochrome P450 n=1 Tax=Algimonas porphyrae TaxID=1128113 RepID=A0ABQ5UX34_9PROT|nr:cytochrome P450 [Algimonas porphyrae]GLQ19849.1 cytochrome P450 [Algimonas porphyrae]